MTNTARDICCGPDEFTTGALRWRSRGYPPLILGGRDGKELLVARITGYSPNDATESEIALWPTQFQGEVNLGVRCPPGVVGLDVDGYDGKRGLTTWSEHIERLGELPNTYVTTARSDGSGIRWYRVPPDWRGHDLRAADGGRGDVELIQRHHRYAVVPPSQHHTGVDYRVFGPDGDEISAGVLPPPTELPELPATWLTELAVTTKARGSSAVAVVNANVGEWLDAQTGDDYQHGLPQVLTRFHRLTETGEKSRHDAMVDVITLAFKESRAGGYPARRAEAELRAVWNATMEGDPGRENEFNAMMNWAIGAAEADDHDARWLQMRRDYGTDTRDYATLIEGVAAHLRNNHHQDSQGQPARPRFVGVTAAELAAPIPPMRWVVQGVWPERSAGVLAGEKKTFKTWNLQAMAIAVASGKPYLGHFAVPKPGPVLYLCGEGGRDGFANRHQVIAARYGIALSDMAELPFIAEFDTAELTNPELLKGISKHLDNLQPELVILDPLYAYHPHDVEATNLYARGPMLAHLREQIEGHAALVIGDHFKKSASGNLDLDDIQMAGISQFADSWALQRHRSAPDMQGCNYFLEVEFATRRAGGHRYEIDWHLDRDPDPNLVAWSACDWSVASTSKSPLDAQQSLDSRILQAIAAQPWVLNRKQLASLLRTRNQDCNNAVQRLLLGGQIDARPPTGAKRNAAHVFGPRTPLVVLPGGKP